MEILTALVTLVVAAFVGEYLVWRPRQACASLARKLGLKVEDHGIFAHIKIAGQRSGIRVEVAGSPQGIEFRLQAPRGSIPTGLYLSREGFQGIFGEEILVGDPAFDDAVGLRGNEAVALALLDRDTRAIVTGLLARGTLVLDSGVLSYAEPDLVRSSSLLEARLTTLLELVRRLEMGAGDIPARLARQARTDLAGVRQRSLEVLLSRFGRVATARKAAAAALADPDAAMRLTAALHLGPPGLPHLEAIASDPEVAAPTRVRALRHLLEHGKRQEVTPLLPRFLDDEAPLVQRAAIEGIGQLRFLAALPGLARLAATAEPPVALAIVAVLQLLGGAEAERILLDNLGRFGGEVELAAVRALGRIGSVVAVEPLLRYAQPGGRDSELQRAAREAVGAIQSRLVDAEAGRLSLAGSGGGGGEGALSLPAEAGALSPAGDEGQGRLSIPLPAPPAETEP